MATFARARSAGCPLLAEPAIDVPATVADVAADLEAGRPGVLISPVAQGLGRDAEQVGELEEREQFVEFVVEAVTALVMAVVVVLRVHHRLLRQHGADRALGVPVGTVVVVPPGYATATADKAVFVVAPHYAQVDREIPNTTDSTKFVEVTRTQAVDRC